MARSLHFVSVLLLMLSSLPAQVLVVSGVSWANVLGLIFLTDVELLASGLALGEGITGDTVSLHRPGLQIADWASTYPPADPVGLDAPEPVAPADMRRAEAEK